MCEGPVDYAVCSEDFCKQRAAFLLEFFPDQEIDYISKVIAPLQPLFELVDEEATFDTIYLWFEDDLFCHINLLAVLSLLFQLDLPAEQIGIICVSERKNQKNKLSAYQPDELRDLMAQCLFLSDFELEDFHTLWQLYCSHDHNELWRFYQANLADVALYGVAESIRAHLSRFPSLYNGLNSLEMQLLTAISQNKHSEEDLIKLQVKTQEQFGFGDLQYRAYLKKMKGLYILEGSHVSISSTGEAILRAERYWEHNPHFVWGRCRGSDFQFDGDRLLLRSPS